MIGRIWKGLALAALATSAPAIAQGNGNLTTKVEVEKSVPGQDGQPASKSYVTPDVVVPGDRVRISLTFTNDGTDAASGVVVANPIPPGLMFDSTDDQAGFGVSIDGGETFAPLADLTVPVDGSVPRPATAADLTHVRWKWAEAIGPGQTRSVAFFARVR
ncbi:DUF11 domain-containing protein [Sphingopyxis sp. JAI128]|uniref:DUF11 domain-containing protein n=1 Tax=Sphingopyxis sp. JAI128 TaxID=2723066 RepID=UPI001620B80E|nr:DUF11 domain-containing protein [Sphingopyxis sp. JAI128]MBB6424380.1 putative repeat protein (TIGR01451 family) [Sphingopyxis sp. JAI128]